MVMAGWAVRGALVFMWWSLAEAVRGDEPGPGEVLYDTRRSHKAPDLLAFFKLITCTFRATWMCTWCLTICRTIRTRSLSLLKSRNDERC